MSAPLPCAWCGRPCPRAGKGVRNEGVREDGEGGTPDLPPYSLTPLLPSQPLCLACTLLSEFEETDESERWNYPEQHWEGHS